MLADYTSYSGNFSTVAIQCLSNCPKGEAKAPTKATFNADQYTFNYLVDEKYGMGPHHAAHGACNPARPHIAVCCRVGAFLLLRSSNHKPSAGTAVYMVVADVKLGRTLPYEFLDIVRKDFREKYDGKIPEQPSAHSLDKSYE